MMKRHEWWRLHYRSARDLDHLSPGMLSERLFDCLNNIRVRTERGKLGLLRPDQVGEEWSVWFTEVLEECVLRGYEYPGPITIAPFRSAFEHVFDPIPNMAPVLEEHDLAGRPHLLKFGDARWLRRSLESGIFRIAPASFYESADLDHARRDTELQRLLSPNPRDPRADRFRAKGRTCVRDGLSGVAIVSPTDYYLFSLSAVYSSRLFGDFSATACLVLLDPSSFLDRLAIAVKAHLAGWSAQLGPVSYYDPVRVDPSQVVVHRFKPFRHAYQAEVRAVWIPATDLGNLEPFEVELGPLTDCAVLVDIESCPPVDLEPDPSDAPIVRYGQPHEDDPMINQLPGVARMQGMLFCREAPEVEKWYFKVQYTDDSGAWHELQIPMLDGLYLLNMLRTAEKEQHLELWNRE
jgi:hypothetical protein